MKMLWFTWRDLSHPQSGGAEVANEEMAKRLTKDGHEVHLIVGGYKGCKAKDTVNGYKITRLGNRYSLYFKAYRYYKKYLVGWADLVIDEMNTMPFFAKYYVKEPNILLAYMLSRQIWFYQMIPPFSLIGYLAEPVYLWLLRDRKVLTESQSTKDDLIRFGFRGENIQIFSVGSDIVPINKLDEHQKFTEPTLLSLGALRNMKRTLHQIKAYESAKLKIPNLKLKIAGQPDFPYGWRVNRAIQRSRFASDIEYLGRVSSSQKLKLMRKCHLILVTSVKEGWGLIVTEAASQGTPAAVYDVDGLRDSVDHGRSGIVAKQNTPQALAEAVVETLSSPSKYRSLREKAWQFSGHVNYDNGYKEFLDSISNPKFSGTIKPV